MITFTKILVTFIALFLVINTVVEYAPTTYNCITQKTECKSLGKAFLDQIFGVDKNIADNVQHAQENPELRAWYLAVSFFNLFMLFAVAYVLKILLIRQDDLDKTSVIFRWGIFVLLYIGYLFVSMIYVHYTEGVLAIPGSGVLSLFSYLLSIFTNVGGMNGS